GSLAAWSQNKVVKAADVKNREYRIISAGPVRSIVELTYEGWSVSGSLVTLRTRITQWAGDRGFYQTITSENAPSLALATGLPLKPNVPAFHSESGRTWLASWGEQVVRPGAGATGVVAGSNLGLGIVMIQPAAAKVLDDPANHLLTFSAQEGSA